LDVQCTTLDGYCDEAGVERLDLVKIDVEGAEQDVLEGAKRTLERLSPTLIVEMNPHCSRLFFGRELDGVYSLLEGLGYAIHLIGKNGAPTRKMAGYDELAAALEQQAAIGDVLCTKP
jgi:hypothetical protein